MVHQCPEYANLQQELQLTLQTLSDLTKTMLDAFQGNDHKLSLAWTRNSKPLSVAKSASSAHSASTLKITSAAERKRRNRIEKSRPRSLNKMAGLPKQNARKPLFRFTRIYTAHALTGAIARPVSAIQRAPLAVYFLPLNAPRHLP